MVVAQSLAYLRHAAAPVGLSSTCPPQAPEVLGLALAAVARTQPKTYSK